MMNSNTSFAFRVNTVVNQINYNASECSNSSIKKLLYIAAREIDYQNKSSELEFVMSVIEDKLRFFENLFMVMEEGQAKNIVAYTISLLEQRDFFSGMDELEEPED